MARDRHDLSTIRFKRNPPRRATTNDDSIPGGFDTFLIHTIGGFTLVEAGDSEQSSIHEAPEERNAD